MCIIKKQEVTVCPVSKVEKQGLDMFKEYLPKTFAKYEEVYAKMGGLLNEGKRETIR